MRVSQKPNTLRDKKVLITAGPTREYWDPVRYLSNGSSGQMGMALAQEAAELGARVTLVLGPTPGPLPPRRKNVRVVSIESALELDKTVQKHLQGVHFFVGAAAVSDYRPAVIARQKIKQKPPSLTLQLLRNPDVIANVAHRGPNRPPVVVGFALETKDVIRHAIQKLKRKGLDWIIANRHANLGSSDGSVTLLSRWNDRITIGRMNKERLAKRIWKALMERSAP